MVAAARRGTRVNAEAIPRSTVRAEHRARSTVSQEQTPGSCAPSAAYLSPGGR